MNSKLYRLGLISVLTSIFVFSFAAFAQLPTLLTVPDSLPGAEKQDLSRWREQLVRERSELRARAAQYKHDFPGPIPIDDPRVAECKARHAQLEADTKQHSGASSNFNFAVQIATQKVRNLARDPALSKANQLLLDQLNGRLARLQKAIDLLGSTNPEWAKEFNRLYEEHVEACHEALLNSLELGTLGLAEGYKAATEAQLKSAQAAFGGQEWAELSRQRDSLINIQKGMNNAALAKWISELDGVEKAVQAHDTASAVARVRESIISGKEAYEGAKKAAASGDDMRALYNASVALGAATVPFAEGLAGKVAPYAKAGFKTAELALNVKLIIEENRQFDDLSRQSVDRNVKRLELMRTVEQLREQKSAIEMTIQRSQSSQ
jgi:hypothetical protein